MTNNGFTYGKHSENIIDQFYQLRECQFNIFLYSYLLSSNQKADSEVTRKSFSVKKLHPKTLSLDLLRGTEVILF